MQLLKIHEIRLANTRKLMQQAGLSRNAFSEKVGISYNLLSQYIGKNPTKNIGDETAEKIEQAFNKPRGYLDQSELSLISSDVTKIEDWDDATPLDSDEVEIVFFKDFKLACGNGSIGEALENEQRKLRISKSTLRNKGIDKKDAVATTASGDSMSPTIKDGDTIHIDTGRKSIKDGKIFAISYGGLFYIKRLYNMPFGGVRIVSDNHDEFPEIILTAEEVSQTEFQIIGWVWQISSMENW